MSSEEPNYLAMSDEAFMESAAMDTPPEVEAAANEDEVADEATEIDDAANLEDEANQDTDDQDADGSDDTDDTDDDNSSDGDTDEDSDEEDADGNDDSTFDDSDSEDDSDEKDAEKESDEETDADSELAKKATEFYKELTTPFKANGKDFKVESAADAKQLIQMGINYNKKMSALKPNLKVLRLLENHGLLDESKLNFLIDIDKKNPKAIAKLVNDSKIEPMDIDVEAGNDYQVPNRTVNDQEIELNTILDDLAESPKYPDLLEVVSNQWDEGSQQTIGANPQVLNVIHDHMNSGVYDLINSKMDRERTMGRLNGLSSLEAYRKIGDDMAANGEFDHLGNQGTDDFQGQQKAKRKVNLEAKKQKDVTRKSKKRAAAGNKATSKAPKGKATYNPLAMSDEQFLAEFNPNLLN